MIRHQLGYAVGDHGIYGWQFAVIDMKLISIASELGFGWRQRLTKQTMLVSEQYVELYPVPGQLQFRERKTCQVGSQVGS